VATPKASRSPLRDFCWSIPRTMSFAVRADAYDRYMGRYSRLLAPRFAEFARLEPAWRVLDVGCGPGALTSELAGRVGAHRVAGANPSPSFVSSCASRVPGADIRLAPAEQLPWPAAAFDAVLSQLVVSFLDDPGAGLLEMRRVVRQDGVIAACTWDYGGEMQMLRTFWDAALALDPAAPDEARVMRYTDSSSLRKLWIRGGIRDVEVAPLVVHVEYAGFDDYWQPFLTGTGPGGQYCVSLDEPHRAALRDECRRGLGAPTGSFTLAARAWAARGSG
jgi:ubiquinone/menaquinone biosynthesis C-methylase UbiE